MKRRVRCLSLALFVVVFFSVLAERTLLAEAQFPSDILSAREIKELVAGQTAEVAIKKTREPGLFYFSPNGEFKQLINNMLEKGHWKVNKNDRLCLRIAQGAWHCRMLKRGMEELGQYVVKKDGSHRRELTYEKFHDGDKVLELAKSASPPLETLRKDEIVLLSVLAERSLLAETQLPSDVLSALDIEELVAGKTAEVVIIKPSGPGLFYFSPNGEFKQLIDNWLEKGHWKVSKNDRLCLRIAQGAWHCRMLKRGMEEFGQYVAKKDGNHRRELTYEKFHDGDKVLELVKSSSPPLEILKNEEIILLFSDKTVESETVRKGRVSLTYYHPDGTLELFRNGKKHSGTWRVTDKSRMCLKLEDSKEKCRIIVKQGTSFSKFIVKKSGQHQQSIYYRRFMPGKQF